jgi:LacI family transcriptional regulator
MVTLKQVAIGAGVHPTTVSVVLNASNGNTRVGEVTRARVMKIAKELGYVRNESARRLRTGTSDAVGFVGGDLRNPFFSELAAALERELKLRNLQLVLSHVAPSQSAVFSKTLEMFQEQMVTKIIYWDESASRTPPAAPANCVLYPIGFTVRPRPGVWLDLGHAIRLAIDYFLKQNIGQICFFAPAGKVESPSVNIRKKMFVEECHRQKLPAPVCAAYDGESWDIEAAVHGARSLLAHEPPIEALVGFNDVAALGFLLATGTARLTPIVVCFDGTPLARAWPTHPPTLDLKISTLARQAVEVAVGSGQSLATIGRKKFWLRPEFIT